MNSKQFAWSYLIKNGRPFIDDGFHGGYYIKESNEKIVSENKELELLINELDKKRYYLKEAEELSKKINEIALNLIKKHGIDWDKTKTVTSNCISKFTDTYSKPDEKEILVGEIILKNENKIYFSCEKEVLDMFEIMANVSILENFYNQNLKF